MTVFVLITSETQDHLVNKKMRIMSTHALQKLLKNLFVTRLSRKSK